MSLFTDRLPVTPDMIIAVDPELSTALQVSSTTYGGTSQSSGSALDQLCLMGSSQCANTIAAHLQSVIGASNFNPSGGATALHNQALIWGIRAQTNVVRIRMGQIVTDPLYTGDGVLGMSLLSPLQDWITYWCITLGYRKLVGRTDAKEDRYHTKYRFCKHIAQNEKWDLLSSTGVPYVRVPFPCPGAVFEPGGGTFTAANVTGLVIAHGATGGTFNLALTWVDQRSQTSYVSPVLKNNAESGPSVYQPVITAADSAIGISISTLIPPSGSVALSEASITGVSQGTCVATGWNVYVGQQPADGAPPSPMYLQNATPIPVSQKSYVFSGDPVMAGAVLTLGQYPDANLPLPPTLMMRM